MGIKSYDANSRTVTADDGKCYKAYTWDGLQQLGLPPATLVWITDWPMLTALKSGIFVAGQFAIGAYKYATISGHWSRVYCVLDEVVQPEWGPVCP